MTKISNAWLALTALMLGAGYCVILFGQNANPLRVDWLYSWADSQLVYVGWLFLRNSPLLTFPLTFSPDVGAPVGLNLAFTDLIPALGIPAKFLSPLLPNEFQYFSLYVALSFAAQAYFVMRLTLLQVSTTPMRAYLIAVGAGALLMLMPSATFRAIGMYVYCGHGIILAALWYYFRPIPSTAIAGLRPFAAIAAIASAINPYYVVMTMPFALALGVRMVLEKRLTLAAFTTYAIVIFLIAAVVGILVGFIDIGEYAKDIWPTPYYGVYSLNLNAMFNPLQYGSLLLPELRSEHVEQYEGYNYLGLGIFWLAAVNVFFGIKDRATWAVFDWQAWVPIVAACAGLTILAVTHKVTLGSVLIAHFKFIEDLGWPYTILSNFRGSGRLFWPVTYVIGVYLIFLTAKRLSAEATLVIFIIGAVLQFADTSELRAKTQTWYHPRVAALKSPEWQTLRRWHSELNIQPPWQCGYEQAPGKMVSFGIFGALAAEQRMRTNSYYSTRLGGRRWEIFCVKAPEEVNRGEWGANTAYVFNEGELDRVRSGAPASHACRSLDGYALCMRREAW